ncbi:Sir2 family NAD-dependent protein deacetylase [Paeniglutamicibacter kerguelensis]|uniref:protein acetyllysine N-acetyltransferase n=1 Tax=Paeniglutamicibacter kerguelensis TaxID=254788 RepID=A0ABS4XFC3_9MICC|nr:Sir2 family NAD-dependent protein deacetylase [Paeniglutamicibacter kerguelensis]MBP2387165.1 NAD-dependent SIR2 family protein deacetylase [Paeniglutamicibacter kerguelensis]
MLHEGQLGIEMARRAAIRSIERVVGENAPLQDPEVASNGIREMLARGSVLVLTGAGVSTDSGIPDYRGPHGSLLRHRPMTYQEFLHEPAARHRYWARSFVGWRHMDKASPNPIHHRLAAWESTEKISGIVTQNVDGLHVAAGSRNVIALHGDLEQITCLKCGTLENRRSLDVRLHEANPGYLERIELDPSLVNPDGDVSLDQKHVDEFTMVGCLVCGSEALKPNVVYFGENVPPERKARLKELETGSSALLVIGSSLAVMSGYKLLLDARAAGKRVGLINGGPTRGDAKADFRWRTNIAEALDLLEVPARADPSTEQRRLPM